jgi:protein-tyrosine phosphatase
MAEGALRVLLEKERPGRFRVMSSGTSAASGYPATIYAIEAARMWNADLSEHKSRELTRQLIERSDLILGMTEEHVREILRLNPEAGEKTFLFKNYPENSPHGEGVADPIGQSLQKYNETFLEIGEYLGTFLPEIVKRIDDAP